jgi:hypothetical protein
MFNKSYRIIFIGLISVLISSAMLYIDMRSSVAYVLLSIGFVLVGVGILISFFKMVSEGNK